MRSESREKLPTAGFQKNKGFFSRLAAGNIRKNGKTYIPYILTCIVTVAMFYMVKSLSCNPGLEHMVGSDTLLYIMFLGSRIVAVFAFIFLFYTNSFLMKRRKKEFGVFHILGMEKKHLSRVLAWETVYVTVISLAVGLALGIALDKVLFLLVTKMIDGEIVLGFFISHAAIRETVILFLFIFLLIFLNSARQIRLSDPVELLRAGNVGEKEPKTRWLMAALGALCLGAGYYIALTTENPIASLLLFFVAVILVIAGTYLLFTAGSIALLKLLRKNKRYYYKTRHFTSVSGMIYRMKQNAVGLANICVLSTMVLVMVSATTSLMVGMEDIIRLRYPSDFVVYTEEKGNGGEALEAVRRLQKEENLPVTKEIQYTYLVFSAIRSGNSFYMDRNAALAVVDSINALFFVPLSDYNAATGENKTLKDGEIMLYSNRQSFDDTVLKVFGREYTVKEHLDSFVGNGIMAANISSTQFIVVPDMEELYKIYELQREELTDIASSIKILYGFDTDAGEEEQEKFYDDMLALFAERGYKGQLESKADSRQSFIGLYGGFFFIGIFLGILFIMATVLIIYYKQISEGYDDKERFEIMQKVGMSREEVKASIRSQVLTVFFLPLLAAGLHTVVAFPLIAKLLALMNMMNTKLYAACTGTVFLVFAAMYILIYVLTAKNYYRIVSQP